MLLVERKMEAIDLIVAIVAGGREPVVGLFTIGEVETDGFTRGEGLIDSNFHTDDGVFDIRLEVDVVDVLLPTSFEIDGLPDAPYVTVALLARETLVVGCVVGDNDEVLSHIVEASEVPGNLNFEGRIATLMGGDETTIEVDLGVPVTSTDNEEDTLIAPGLWNKDVAGIVTAVA